VTHRKDMRSELILILRMLLGLPPAVMGDLPSPEAAARGDSDKTEDEKTDTA